MQIRDAFFESMNKKDGPEEIHAERVRKDIAAFRTGLAELTENIGRWMQGTGIKTAFTETTLYDDTVTQFPENRADGSYVVPRLSLTKGKKIAVIKAEWLYGFGVTGCVSLTTLAPRRLPQHAGFLIYMRTSEQQKAGWTIVRDNMLRQNASLLTEENFTDAVKLIL
ncbi:hypothetical protein XB02_18975 [Pantoea ananatis]|nr:hypothetical protein XB02_18975 [Pantoea ananatis]